MIGILVFPEFQLIDATGPISVFELARPFAGMTIDVRLLAADAGLVRSSSGIEVVARDLESSQDIKTLIVVGGDGFENAVHCKCTLGFINRLFLQGVRIASVCTGAYILAEAGILQGRQATTHWCQTREFTRRYPMVTQMADQIFTRDGNIWTSAGATAGIDLALAMVALDHGKSVARDTARMLVMHHRRSGSESQYSPLLELQALNGRFGDLLTWAKEHLSSRLTVDDLAERAGMNARHFARSFTAEMGVTPAKAVEQLRVQLAQERLQSSGDPIERVARFTGFGDPERMRRAFIRTLGHPPSRLMRSA